MKSYKSMQKRAIEKALQEHDEGKQIKFIRKMAKALPTSKLLSGYYKIKDSKKPADIKACNVMMEELDKRGVDY